MQHLSEGIVRHSVTAFLTDLTEYKASCKGPGSFIQIVLIQIRNTGLQYGETVPSVLSLDAYEHILLYLMLCDYYNNKS